MSDPYFDRFRILSGTYWDAYVSERGGNNLGRVYFWLHRDGIVDFHELSDPELQELRELTRRLTKAIKALFKPDGPMNFAYLANEPAHGHHCHYHLVPRYKREVHFGGISFIDPTWGRQWQSALMDESLAIQVGEKIKESLQK